MHGLVQPATRTWLRSTNTERIWHQAFIQAMAREFPDGEYANWPKCQILFPHVVSIGEQEGSDNEKTAESALVLNNAGWYAWRQGLLAQAEGMVTKALETRKEVLDANDFNTLISLSILGSILADMGKYKAAEAKHRQDLELSEKVLGEEHPSTLTSMNNLAVTWKGQSRDEEATKLMDDCVRLRTQVLGSHHPLTLSSSEALNGWKLESLKID